MDQTKNWQIPNPLFFLGDWQAGWQGWMLDVLIFDPHSRTEIISDFSYFCLLFQSKNMILLQPIYGYHQTGRGIGKFSMFFLNNIVYNFLANLDHAWMAPILPVNSNHHILCLSFPITKTASLCICFYLPNKHNQSCSKLSQQNGATLFLTKRDFFVASKT